MSADFKKAAAPRDRASSRTSTAQRNPGRDVDELTDEDLLREVMNTVGKPGKLGEHVRCVVSVSMLTEGWDANTVTHILGVRAFGTQLLCEQVVGRGLRRRSLRGQRRRATSSPSTPRSTASRSASSPPAGSATDPTPAAGADARARARRARATCEITFPRVDGYRVEIPTASGSTPTFSDASASSCSRRRTCRPRPTCSPIVGEQRRAHARRPAQRRREQEVAFALAKRDCLRALLRRTQRRGCSRSSSQSPREWIARVRRPARTTPSRSCCCSHEHAERAAEQIYERDRRAPTQGEATPRRRCSRRTTPRARPTTSTSTPRSRSWSTDPDKCHVSHVVADTELGAHGRRAARRHAPRCAPTSRTTTSASRSRTPSTATSTQYVPDFLVARRRRPRRRRPAEPDHRGVRRRRSAPSKAQGRRPPATCGCRRSTTTAASAAGRFIEITDPLGRRAARSAALFAQPTSRSRCPREAAEAGEEGQPARRRSRRSATSDKRANIPTDELRDFVADDETRADAAALPARPVARPAARLEGQGRAGRRRTSRSPTVPIYIQEKIDPRVLIENLRQTAAAGEDEPELTLFDDFDGLEFEDLVEFYQHEPTGRTA